MEDELRAYEPQNRDEFDGREGLLSRQEGCIMDAGPQNCHTGNDGITDDASTKVSQISDEVENITCVMDSLNSDDGDDHNGIRKSQKRDDDDNSDDACTTEHHVEDDEDYRDTGLVDLQSRDDDENIDNAFTKEPEDSVDCVKDTVKMELQNRDEGDVNEGGGVRVVARRLHSCSLKGCTFCETAPCGSCSNCTNKKNKNKCLKRMCPRLNYKIERHAGGTVGDAMSGNKVCQICGSVFSSKYSLIRHLRSGHNNKSGGIKGFAYGCETLNCNFTTPFRWKIMGHFLNEQHEECRTVFCLQCGKKYKDYRTAGPRTHRRLCNMETAEPLCPISYMSPQVIIKSENVMEGHALVKSEAPSPPLCETDQEPWVDYDDPSHLLDENSEKCNESEDAQSLAHRYSSSYDHSWDPSWMHYGHSSSLDYNQQDSDSGLDIKPRIYDDDGLLGSNSLEPSPKQQSRRRGRPRKDPSQREAVVKKRKQKKEAGEDQVSQSTDCGRHDNDKGKPARKAGRHRHSCNMIGCTFCSADPCGTCKNCINKQYKNKCFKRMCPRLNYRSGRDSGGGGQEVDAVSNSRVCKECGAVFSSKQSLQRHLVSGHIKKRSVGLKGFIYGCDTPGCHYKTPFIWEILSHFKHEQHQECRIVFCVQCGKKYNDYRTAGPRTHRRLCGMETTGLRHQITHITPQVIVKSEDTGMQHDIVKSESLSPPPLENHQLAVVNSENPSQLSEKSRSSAPEDAVPSQDGTFHLSRIQPDHHSLGHNQPDSGSPDGLDFNQQIQDGDGPHIENSVNPSIKQQLKKRGRPRKDPSLRGIVVKRKKQQKHKTSANSIQNEENEKKGQHARKAERHRHSCNMVGCTFCSADPCGTCKNCTNKQYKNKCSKRMCPRLNYRNGWRAAEARASAGDGNAVSDTERRFCMECGAAFSNKYNLIRHLKSGHSRKSGKINGFVYGCDTPDCGFRTVSRSEMQIHFVDQQHAECRVIFCILCEKKYNDYRTSTPRNHRRLCSVENRHLIGGYCDSATSSRTLPKEVAGWMSSVTVKQECSDEDDEEEEKPFPTHLDEDLVRYNDESHAVADVKKELPSSSSDPLDLAGSSAV